jgi:hypothetical protein
MAFINRDGDITEKKEWFQWSNQYGLGVSGLVQTGQTFVVGGPMPFPGTIQSGQVYATGISGAPQLALTVQRFVPGGGFTNITIGLSNMVVQAVSTSGPQGFSGLAAPGSTLLNFLTGDAFMITTSVSNTAIQSLLLQFVVIKTQDIVSHNKLSV